MFKTLNEMKQIRIIGFQIFNDFKDLWAILKYNYFKPFVPQFYKFKSPHMNGQESKLWGDSPKSPENWGRGS